MARRVRVAGAGLLAVAAASVAWLLLRGRTDDARLEAARAEATETGATGSAALPPLPDRAGPGVSTDRDPSDRPSRSAEFEEAYDLASRARVRISGRVSAPDGTPVAGVDVTAHVLGPDGDRLDPNAGSRQTGADGAYAMNLPAPEPPLRLVVRARTPSGSRWSHAEPEFHVVTGDTDRADFTLVPLPAVRVRVVDARDGRPIPDATAEGWHTERDGDALVLYLSGHFRSRRGSLRVGFRAPGYLPAHHWISPPESGVATRDEPVALEPAVEATGVLRKRTGAGIAGWVVVEPIDGRSVEPPLAGDKSENDGRWCLPLRAGRYRLLALVFGRPPWRGTLQVAHGAEPTEIIVAEPGEDVPATPRFTWAQRRDVALPVVLPAMGFGGLERVRWLAEIADAPIAIDDDVVARLSRATAPAVPAGERLHRALQATAREAGLEFDDPAGRIRAPQPR